MQALGLLIIDHPVGFERRVAEVELHVADGRHALVTVVVIDLRGAHEHLLLRAVGFDRRLGARRERPHLGERRRRAPRAGDQQGGGQQDHQRPTPGAPTSQPRMGGRPRHYPSSWYSSAIKPVTPPTAGGNPAAAIGPIRPALLKSAVPLAMTESRKPAPIPPNTIFCTPPKRKKRKLTDAARSTMATR